MSNVTIDRAFKLASDGVLQGWCWNPNRPAERLVVEILINERIVSAFVASRFREDLPGRNIGDGYYGFITTIAKSLLDAGDDFVISARERSSAYCFWRQVRGESGLPNDFVSRFAEARQRLSRVAQSSHLRAFRRTFSYVKDFDGTERPGYAFANGCKARRHPPSSADSKSQDYTAAANGTKEA